MRPLETAEEVTVFSEHNYWALQGGAEEVRANVTTTDAAPLLGGLRLRLPPGPALHGRWKSKRATGSR